MKKHNKIALLFIVFFLCRISSAQDPTLSQPYANNMQTNPALTGAYTICTNSLGGQFVLNYNYKDVHNNNRHRNFTAAYQQHASLIGGGIGFVYSRNIIGDKKLVRNSINLDYSYLVPLGKRWSFRFGLEGTLNNQGIDYGRVKYSSDVVVAFPSNHPLYSQEKKSFFNYSSGVVLYSDKFYAGFALHNIGEPNQSFENDPNGNVKKRYSLQSGIQIGLSKKYSYSKYILPNFLVVKQNNFHRISSGVYLAQGPYNIGFLYNNEENGSLKRNSITTLIGYSRYRYFIGYSYDANLSSKSAAYKGIHELTARVEWTNILYCRRIRGIPCPVF